ncbi:MAG: aminoacetone oxidase family FAD-binding enzyme [Oscillospiraceae bacterium]
MQEQYDVIVVGGGAAGMFAAIHVGLAGKRVLLLERNDRLGKKLRITGKGRCNVTNCCTAEEVLQHVPRNGRFLYSAVTQYPPARMMEFLEAEGCPLKTERGNRVFPVSDSSASVQQALERALGRAGVTVRQSRVLEVWTDAGQVAGVRTDQEQIPAGKVILATGGCSYPATGSTGDGYRMAAQLGHTVIPPTGSLVPEEA